MTANPWLQKIGNTILTRGGLKAMEELAKLKAQRGNPEYLEGEMVEDGFREREAVGHKRKGIHGNGDFGKNGNRRAGNVI